MKRMGQLSFVLPELHAKLPGDALHIRERSSQEVPPPGTRGPGARVLRERVALIERWIDRNRQEDEVVAQSLFETPLQLAEVARKPEAVRRIGTANVRERECDNFARHLRQRDGMPFLVDEGEIRDTFAGAKRLRRLVGRQPAQEFEPFELRRLLLEIFVPANL